MFTGIIEKTAAVSSFELRADGASLIVATGFRDLAQGESVAVNGVCLTVTELTSRGDARFFIGTESLRRTNLGALLPGASVNLERALQAGSRLSGHVVQGHVDGLATLVSVEPEGSSRRMTFELKPELVRYCVEKGSIALNGTSLTLSRILSGASCAGDAPSRILPEQVVVHVIPHTWAETNLGELKPGDPVNCEVDIFAKYVERLCQPYQQR